MRTLVFVYFFVELGCRPWSYLVYYATCAGVYFHFSLHDFFLSLSLFYSILYLYECSLSIMHVVFFPVFSFFLNFIFFHMLWIRAHCCPSFAVRMLIFGCSKRTNISYINDKDF